VLYQIFLQAVILKRFLDLRPYKDLEIVQLDTYDVGNGKSALRKDRSWRCPLQLDVLARHVGTRLWT